MQEIQDTLAFGYFSLELLSCELIYHVYEYKPFWYQNNPIKWGWGRHICIGKRTIIGSDNGLSPGRRQAHAEIFLIRTLGTNVSEILSEIHAFLYARL